MKKTTKSKERRRPPSSDKIVGGRGQGRKTYIQEIFSSGGRSHNTLKVESQPESNSQSVPQGESHIAAEVELNNSAEGEGETWESTLEHQGPTPDFPEIETEAKDSPIGGEPPDQGSIVRHQRR